MSGVTAAAIGGLVISATTAGLSFAQQAKQNKQARALGRQADKMMAEARKKLEVKFTEAMSAQKQVYEQARESLLSTAARGIEAGMEGEQRGAAATVGRAVLGVGEAERGISAAQEQELRGIEKAQIDEAKALRDMGVQLDLGEVSGLQKAQSEAEQRAELARAQAFQSAGSALQSGLSLVPTFIPDAGARQTATVAAADQIQLAPEQITQLQEIPGYQGATSDTPASFNVANISDMTKQQFKQFESVLSPQQLGQIRGSEQYKQAYSPTFFGMQMDPFALDYLKGTQGSGGTDAAQLALLRKLLQQ
jgi:hypothetical protein